MHKLPIYVTIAMAVCALTGCDAHDYWLLTETLEVNSDENVLSVYSESINQDLFVRYQLDYQVKNLSDTQPTEVVVSGTSYVNLNERAVGQKVWHLEPSEVGEGILTPSQLQLGNDLLVTLSCCSESRCSRKDVLCPDQARTSVDIYGIAEFCYNSCDKDIMCTNFTCPSEAGCEQVCKDKINQEQCRKDNCGYGGSAGSCAFMCGDDITCLMNCTPTLECVDKCNSLQATCFSNCISTWTQCTDEIYQPDFNQIPCLLCGEEGICLTDFNGKEQDAHSLTKLDGTKIECDLDCHSYPGVCIDACEEAYDTTESRVGCLTQCIRQHQYWCNDYSMVYDYVDSQGKQPCCFEEYCHNTLEGVVKTYDVECFNDTSCSSGKSCSPEGVCVTTGESGCQGTPKSGRTSIGLYLLGLLTLFGYCRRRREVNHG